VKEDQPLTPQTSEPITVLAAEDEAHIRRLLEYTLTKGGFKVTTVSEGEEALSVARKGKFQLILLDVMMPKKTGLEVLHEIKASSSLKNTPVFMLTALSMVGDMDKAFETGADDYITKPFDPLTFCEIIHRKLEKFHERKKSL
jgi:DNA-binding response OmpR family regulator